MNRRLMIQAARDGDVPYLLQENDNNPSMLQAMALECSENLLHVACFGGHVDFAATVIKVRREFCSELNQDGFSPLHIAAACGHVEIVKELLKVHPGLCLIKGKDSKIPLHLAVVKGKVDFIRELLWASWDSVECATAQLETCLHLAVKNNQFEALQVLIKCLKLVKKEYLLNSKDMYGNTILHIAVSMKQYEVVDSLLSGQVTSGENMELNSLNKSGLTALDMLMMFQSEAGDREIEEILIKAGALESKNLQSPAVRRDGRPLLIDRPSHQPEIRHENPRPRPRNWTDFFKFNRLQDSPNTGRETLLVIAILLMTATYQIALSPPGGVWQDDYNPEAAGNNSTLLSPTVNYNITTIPHKAGKAIMGTNYVSAYTIIMFANTMGFQISAHTLFVLTVKLKVPFAVAIPIGNAYT